MAENERFDADGVRVAYDDIGEGEPVVLVHGFASDRHGNWAEPSWYEVLQDAGRRVIALDCRGHGESEKPHDPAAYGPETMADDVVALLDHLGVERADLMGYSMGGRVASHLLVDHPERFEAVVPAGIGDSVLKGWSAGEAIAAALEADDVDDIDDPAGRRFRLFAEENDNDLAALAAVQRAPGTPIDPERLAEVSNPVLVVVGAADDLVGDAEPLAAALPNAEAELVPGGDHLTTVGDQRYKDSVLEFLDREGL